MNALANQVGGSHYKSLHYQPIELIAKLNLNFFQGNIVKYVSRYKDKNGKEDLQKALHYAELGRQLKPCSFFTGEGFGNTIIDFCEKNAFDRDIHTLLVQLYFQNWTDVIVIISNLIEEYD